MSWSPENPDPDCPDCHGAGSVPFDPTRPAESHPCARCSEEPQRHPSEWEKVDGGWNTRLLPTFEDTRHGLHVYVEATGYRGHEEENHYFNWTISIRWGGEILTSKEEWMTEENVLKRADFLARVFSVGISSVKRGAKSEYWPDVEEAGR